MPPDPSLPPELTCAVPREPAPKRLGGIAWAFVVIAAIVMVVFLSGFVIALGGNEY